MVAISGEGEEPADRSAHPDVLSAPEMMRAGREAAGMSIADVAQATRVPQRHLEALERGDYASLPSITYCTGFARAFARAVNIDAVALVAKVREEVNGSEENAASAYAFQEAADPARIPPRWLAIAALALVVVLLGAYAVWRTQMNTLPAEVEVVPPPPASVAQPANQAAPVTAPAQASGPVVLTAIDDVWMRVYEKDGRRYFDQTLTKGSSFTVPADAINPLILTGRPDALAVTIGGRAVPPLGTAERTVADLPIGAAALLARPPAGSQSVEPGNAAQASGAGSERTQQSQRNAPSASPAVPPRPVTLSQPAPVIGTGAGAGNEAGN